MYAVRKGRATGVFNTWEECQESTKGYKGADYRKVSSIEEGMHYIETGKLDKVEGYYACRTTGEIFTNWKDCQDVVIGVSGAEYKKFKTEEEAVAWLSEDTRVSNKRNYDYSVPIFFTGVYQNGDACGIGCILVDNEGIKYGGCRQNTTNNIQAQLSAVLFAIQTAKEMSFSHIQIVYEYEGVRKWADGTWKPRKAYTQDFKNFIDSCGVHIDFLYKEDFEDCKYSVNVKDTARVRSCKGDFYEWKDLLGI